MKKILLLLGIAIACFSVQAQNLNLEVKGIIKSSVSSGQLGLNLSESNAYAYMRVNRDTLGTIDNDLYFNFQGPVVSKLHFYSDGLVASFFITNLLHV